MKSLCLFMLYYLYSAYANYPTYLYINPGGAGYLAKKERVDRTERASSPSIPPYARENCATTAGNDAFPWWEVKLDKEAYITGIEVYSNLPNDTYKLHDLEIRVGNEDIRNTPKNTAIHKNIVCNQLNDVIDSKNFFTYCKQNLIGQHISLQITKPCGNRCTTNVLSLCEVLVKGYKLDDRKELITSRKVTVRQSSVILGGNPSLAVDGSFKTKFYDVTKKDLCAVIYENTSKKYVTYEIVFNDVYEIRDITFESTSKITDPFTIEAFVEFEGFKNLNEKSKEPSQKCGSLNKRILGKHTIKCDKKYLGKAILLRVKRNCGARECPGRVSNGNITNCKFEIRGYPVENVALGKDSKQSSTYRGNHSVLAVDGYVSENHLQPSCAHTSDTVSFPYPWWRVDLAAGYLVDSVLIYNRWENLHHRLHDIDIRIGKEDISQFYTGNQKARFSANRLCKSFVGKILDPGANYVTCDHPLIGRYVSIQITQNCNMVKCAERNKNLLTLCEVEIYGFPINIYTSGNVALGKTPAKGTFSMRSTAETRKRLSDLAALHKYVNDRDVRWWQLDLGEAHAVETVQIIPSDKYNSNITVEAIVGFVDFRNLDAKSNQPFKSSTICNAGSNSLSNSITLDCFGHTIGRYVTILSPGVCASSYCNDNIKNFLKIKLLNVWAGKFKKDNLGEQIPIQWNSSHALVADETKLEKVLKIIRTPQCTHTATSDIYPWWQAEFPETVVVESVEIYNREEFSYRLHNIEVRVGSNDIPSYVEDKPFTSNHLCVSKTASLPKGNIHLFCTNPLVGKFLTIQITSKCKNTDCRHEPYNILSLCEVKIKGFKLKKIGSRQNLALGASTSQSSTGFNKGSQLAVDGRTPEELFSL